MQKGTNGNGDMNSTNSSSADAQLVLQIGEKASQLLNNPVFQVAYKAMMDEYYVQWATSQPKESNKRDALYYEQRGLMRMTEKLQGAVEDAHEILQRQGQQTDPETQQQDYYDQQGFGLNYN